MALGFSNVIFCAYTEGKELWNTYKKYKRLILHLLLFYIIFRTKKIMLIH